MAVPFVRHILLSAPSRPASSHPVRSQRARVTVPRKPTVGRDLDLAVLRPENQSATRVTPRIAKLAEGYFRDEIMVVGSAPPPMDKVALEADKKRTRRRLWYLIEKATRKKRINYNKNNRVSVQYQYYTEVEIEGKPYKASIWVFPAWFLVIDFIS